MLSSKYIDIIDNKKTTVEIRNCVLNKTSCIVHGPVGCGKTQLVQSVLQTENKITLHFDASVKRSIKNVNDTIHEFRLSNIENKIIFFDEFECVMSEGLGASSIFSILEGSKLPFIVCIDSGFMLRMQKISGKRCTYIAVQKPSKSALLRLCTTIANREKISISQKRLKEKIEFYDSDIRKLVNNIASKDLSLRNDLSCYDICHMIFKWTDISANIKLAQSDVFSIVPIMHENYINISSNVDHCAKLLSDCDVIHTTTYSSQCDYSDICSLLGAVYTSRLCDRYAGGYNFKYGSVLSKISNIQTKERKIQTLKTCCNVKTNQQLFVLEKIGYTVNLDKKQATMLQKLL